MDIMELLTNFGFPVMACGAMAYYVKYITDQHRLDRNSEHAQHKEEMQALTTALSNNTLALSQITDAVQTLKEEVRQLDRNFDRCE